MKEHPRKVLSLSPLYDFVSKHGSVGDDALRLRGTRVGTEYCRLCDEITKPSPSANLVRPAPVRNVQDDAARIFAQFREIIHRNRPDKPSKLQRRVERRFGANLPVLGEDSSEYVTTAH
jgi:hypothetical protein